MAVLSGALNPAGAVNGATIATTDTGDLTAWELVQNTVKYDNTHTLFGKTLSALIDTSGAASFAWLQWTASYGSPNDDYGRFYIYFGQLPDSKMTLLQSYGGASVGIGIHLNSNGTLVLAASDQSGTVGTSTTVLATGQWYRIEYRHKQGVTQPVSLSIFTSPDSTTAAETISGTLTTGPQPQIAVVGISDNNHTAKFWAAQIAVKGTAAIGPYPVSTTAPTVSGSAPVGSLLTCDGGTWNGGATFTLGYAWTRDGSPIGGATSSTYTTVTADATHAIGCTVTATGVQATNESASQASSNTVTVSAATVTAGSGIHPAYIYLRRNR